MAQLYPVSKSPNIYVTKYSNKDQLTDNLEKLNDVLTVDVATKLVNKGASANNAVVITDDFGIQTQLNLVTKCGLKINNTDVKYNASTDVEEVAYVNCQFQPFSGEVDSDSNIKIDVTKGNTSDTNNDTFCLSDASLAVSVQNNNSAYASIGSVEKETSNGQTKFTFKKTVVSDKQIESGKNAKLVIDNEFGDVQGAKVTYTEAKQAYLYGKVVASSSPTTKESTDTAQVISSPTKATVVLKTYQPIVVWITDNKSINSIPSKSGGDVKYIKVFPISDSDLSASTHGSDYSLTIPNVFGKVSEQSVAIKNALSAYSFCKTVNLETPVNGNVCIAVPSGISATLRQESNQQINDHTNGLINDSLSLKGQPYQVYMLKDQDGYPYPATMEKYHLAFKFNN